MISRPDGLLFRHHTEFFDCPSKAEHLALRQRLAQVEQALAAARSGPTDTIALRQRLAQVEQELAQARSAPPPPAGATFLAHCESVMSDLTPAQAPYVARTFMPACWAAHIPVPPRLDQLSKSDP